jgi:hypothetical protein
MTKYTTLLNILDVIRKEAPKEFKRYNPPENKSEELNNARARAYIHLFLKVRFGILDFVEREKFITDDPQDGGIDGYYIDEPFKTIYFIQSKFRITEKNFNEKEILVSELLQMDVSRVCEGERENENGIPYNSKIYKFQSEIQKIPDIAKWRYEVFILGNVTTKVTPSQIKKLTGGLPATIYNNNKAIGDNLSNFWNRQVHLFN